MNHKFLFSISTLGLIAGISATKTKAETYMCEPCPAGYYCQHGNKSSCPSDSICYNGRKYNKSSCIKSVLTTLTSGTAYALPPGIYNIEAAGGGGGGGSSDKHEGGMFNTCQWWHCGCDGGKGSLESSTVFTLSYAAKLNYNIGTGGNGGGIGNKGYGNTGGTTSFDIITDNGTINVSAEGGYGGKNVEGDKGPTCTDRDAGNGNGANGGSHGSCGNCKENKGNKGANGWITIYQWAC